MVIGLTGGIASGKSTVSKILSELGATIIDADIIARKVVKKGEIAYFKIVEYFGDEVLQADGELNRKKLGSIVFSDKEKLSILNSITHPHIIDSIKVEIKKQKESGEKVIVLDAAILIELGLQRLVDTVWLVIVSEKTQIQRLMQRDGVSYDEAMSRILTQYKNKDKIKYADFIIDNDKQLDELSDFIKDKYFSLISRGE